MSFKKYISIPNHYYEKDMFHWLLNNPEMKTMKFILTEKMHGANIQLDFAADGSFSVGKRTSYIEINEKFFNVWSVLEEMDKDIQRLKRLARKKNGFTIYGELFGGKVQKGVSYGERQQILFFDMIVDGKFVSQSELIEIMADCIIPHRYVPILGYADGLENALQFNVEVDSIMTPDGYEGENICEGAVIKPLYSVVTGDRPLPYSFMVKKKNDKFKEKQKERKPPKALPEHLKNLAKKFSCLINEQRVNNIYSNHGTIERPDQIGEYIGLVIKDAIDEFMIENRDEFEKLDKGERKVVTSTGRVIPAILMKSL